MLLFTIMLMTGCLGLPQNRLAVPFVPPPEPNHCGVNCLAMALDYFHIDYNHEKLWHTAFVPALKGAPPELLADTAAAYGLAVSLQPREPAEIQQAVENGLIPIVFIPPAPDKTIGHFILVTRVSANPTIIWAHDGKHAHRQLRLDDTPYITLLLTPREKDDHETQH